MFNLPRCNGYHCILLVLALVMNLAVIPSSDAAVPLGTAFTFQGELNDNGSPVNDTCDFEFTLWDAASGGGQAGNSPQLVSGQSVIDGRFTTSLDFGGGAIAGDARWLEMSVCCPSPCTVQLLTPRQKLTPAPYSLRAAQGVGPPGALEIDITTGHVGIGTISPSVALEVNGDFITKGPWIDVRAFGAKGDGITDDTNAIQSAIDFCSATDLGGIVYIPRGMYRITDQITLQDNNVGASGHPQCPSIDNSKGLTIQGDGYDSFLAFDRAGGSLIGLYGICATNITVKNLRLGALPGTAGFGRGIAFDGGSNITIRDNDISGAGQGGECNINRGGVWLGGGLTNARILDNNFYDNLTAHIIIRPTNGLGQTGAHRVQIRGNRCITDDNTTNQANYGIIAYSSTYVHVSGNYVEGMVQSTCDGISDADGYGIAFYGKNGSSNHHRAAGNTIVGTGGIGIYVQSSPYTSVSGNIIEDVVITQSATSLAAAGIGCTQGPVSIIGNVIRNVGLGNTTAVPPSGITIGSCIAPSCTEVTDGIFRGFTVSGNTIESTASYGININATLPYSSASNSTIIGNTLINTVGGIRTHPGISGCTIIGNSIIRAIGPDDSNQGMFLQAISNSVIAGNVVTNSGQQGIVLNTGSTRNVISSNILRDSGRNGPNFDGIRVNGTNNLIIGNHSFDSCMDSGQQRWGISEDGANNAIVSNDITGDPTVDFDINSTSGNTIMSLNRGRVNLDVLQPICADTTKGITFYHTGLSKLCFCDGSVWKQIDGGGLCLEDCGNGEIDPGEVCDDGSGVTGNGSGEGMCLINCLGIQACGDGIMQ